MLNLKVGSLNLNKFQMGVLNVLDEYFHYFIPNTLSDKSYFDEGDNPDCFLYSINGSSLVFSVSKDEVHINSIHFDLYITSDTDFALVSLLIKEVLLGNYTVIIQYGKNKKFIQKETVFDDGKLAYFNDIQKKLRFGPKPAIELEDKLRGFKWING